MQVYLLETMKKHGFEGVPLWYEYEPDGVIENKVYTIQWNFTIQDHIKIQAQGPD